jgi:hypothetical protein
LAIEADIREEPMAGLLIKAKGDGGALEAAARKNFGAAGGRIE